jgi:hypothetical protein
MVVMPEFLLSTTAMYFIASRALVVFYYALTGKRFEAHLESDLCSWHFPFVFFLTEISLPIMFSYDIGKLARETSRATYKKITEHVGKDKDARGNGHLSLTE